MKAAPSFGPFEDAIWINCAHQGPLSRAAAEAAQEAIRWKVHPFELDSRRFEEVPARLKRVLGRLIGAPSHEIILANSVSYGLHLLANGLPLLPDDEVLLVKGDFPSVVLPWLRLERKGVAIRWIDGGDEGLDAVRLAENLSPKTRVLCTAWVHSFTGRALDITALGTVCRDAGVSFVVNAAQALGARPLDVSVTPVDAVVGVGFKWLCGPYGTGLCWMRPELLETLDYNQVYWLSMQSADDLAKESAVPRVRDDLGARAYDVFGTANFFNFVPWTVAVEELLEHGIDTIAAYDDALVARILAGLSSLDFRIVSPLDPESRSTLVIASHPERSRNGAIHRALTEERIHTAHRRGNLRFSPHLYNTEAEIDRLLEALSRLA